MTVPLRAALYLRVSTARQAEHDVSIPDGRETFRLSVASRRNFNCRKESCPAIAPKRPLSGSAMGTLQIA